ncbi:MAG: alpha/beta fold hydrolase [Haloplanus sp.]
MPDPADPAMPDETEGESRFVETNGVRLHTVAAGPEDRPLVVLLHGFPEFWYGWHELIRPLANAGYRVVALDQRGYNASEKPAGVAAYHVDELAADVAGLVDALGHESAHVVGHDWGAAVAWWLALHHPDRVRTLTAVDVPHPTVFRRTLRRSWDQRRRSWYIPFLAVPALPERLMRAGDWWFPVHTMRSSSRPGTFDAADFERYRAAWRAPGAFTAMLNWYRSLVRDRPEPRTERVDPPTLVCWGGRDSFLRTSMARQSLAYCRDARLAVFPDATHWVVHEEPARLADYLLEQFA